MSGALAAALALTFCFKALLLLASGGLAWASLAAIVSGFANASVLVYGGGLLAALLIEASVTGWQASSARRLLVAPSDSARGDLFFVFLALSGGAAAATTLLSAGLVDAVVAWSDAASARGPLSGQSAWLAAPLLYFGMTFFNYWNHRLLHTRWLWPLHAVHHSAQDFTICNAARVSPTEIGIVTLSQALPAALLGASADAILIASLVASFEILWTHSRLPGLAWLERIGLSSPRAHVIHHAREARYHNRNFGDLVLLWDQLFGTYLDSRQARGEIPLGVDGLGSGYDCRRPVRDYLQTHWAWMCSLRRLLRAPAG